MYWPVAGLYTLMYPIGIPMLLLYKLASHRHILYDPLTKKPHGTAKAKFGFMYDMYKPTHWYWEIFDLYRKLFLCAVLQFIKPYTATQIVFALVFQVFYAMFMLHNSPLKNDTDSALNTLAELELFSVALAAMSLKVEFASENTKTLDILLVTIACVPLFVFAASATYVALASLKIISPRLGYEATRKMYPGVVMSYNQFLTTHEVKKTYNERLQRYKATCPLVYQQIQSLMFALKLIDQRDEYAAITLSIVEQSMECLNVWSKAPECNVQRLEWLCRVCEAYFCVLDGHDSVLKRMDLHALLDRYDESTTHHGAKDGNGDSKRKKKENFAKRTLIVLKSLVVDSNDLSMNEMMRKAKKLKYGDADHEQGGLIIDETNEEKEEEEEEEPKETEENGSSSSGGGGAAAIHPRHEL